MIDEDNITHGELLELAKAGNKEAIAILQELNNETAKYKEDFERELGEKNPDAKTMYDYAMGHLLSDNPIHRAFVADIPLMSIYEQGKRLAEENKKRLDPPRVKVTQGAAKPENNLRCPKRGTKKHNDWKATWRKVKGSWRGGNNYQQLSKLANFSPETIADIVKAGDAGLLD